MRRAKFGFRLQSFYLGTLAAALLACLLVGPLAAEATQVAVYTTEVQATKDGTLVTITARLLVTNNELSPVTGLVVVRDDGSVVPVGDIPPQGQVVSGPYAFTADVAQWPSRYLGAPATLQFSMDGAPVEVPWALSYELPE